MNDKKYNDLIESIKKCIFKLDGKQIVIVEYNPFILMLSKAIEVEPDKLIEDTFIKDIPDLFDKE